MGVSKFLAKSLKLLLERVKRSDPSFLNEFSSLYQLPRRTANFCVGRLVGRFIGRFYCYRASIFEVPISSTGAYLLYSAWKSMNCATRATGHVVDMPKSTRMTRADLGTARAFNLYVADSAIEGAGELRRINARQELLSRD